MERNSKGQFVKGYTSCWKGKKRPDMKHEGQFKKGHTPWNKGKSQPSVKGDKNPAKRPEVRKKISEAAKGRKFTNEHKKRLSEAAKESYESGRVPWNKGKRYESPETSKENHWNWKGGITPESQLRFEDPNGMQ